MNAEMAAIVDDIQRVRYAEQLALSDTLARYATGRFADAVPAQHYKEALVFYEQRVTALLAALRAGTEAA